MNTLTKLEDINFYNRCQISKDMFYSFLSECFPDFSYRQYQKINYSRNFVGWVWGEDSNGAIVACTGIFRRKDGYKMGLFCTHPERRRGKIGTRFYNYIVGLYYPLEWTAITQESIEFYRKIGAIDYGKNQGIDGRYYTMFKSK